MELTLSSGNVFLDLGVPPEEAENLKIRSALMISIRNVEAAEVFGVTQMCMVNVICGKVDLLSIDTLVNMLACVGLRVELPVGQART